jgi:hypothetical protein
VRFEPVCLDGRGPASGDARRDGAPAGVGLISPDDLPTGMVRITPPTERTCERCGREDVWSTDRGSWTIDGAAGDPYCLHEWDINGSYNPVAE